MDLSEALRSHRKDHVWSNDESFDENPTPMHLGSEQLPLASVEVELFLRRVLSRKGECS